MPSYTDVIPPPWNESDSVRETTLILIDRADDREALRQVGRLLYDLAVEATAGPAGDESPTHAEMRAALADLRFLEGYLAMIGKTATSASLPPEDDVLARFGGKLAGKVAAVAEAIEGRLS